MKSKKQIQMAILAMKKQAGMTLMEIIAALAIIAAVVVGALALFTSAQSSNQAVAMLKDLIAIRSAVQQLYIGQGGYGVSTALNPVLIAARKVPTDMSVAGNVINTPLSGTLTVTSNAAGNAFTITITNVAPEICLQLLTNASSGWAGVTVGGAAVGGGVFPIPVATAQAPCTGTAAAKTIVWTTLQ